MQDFFERYADRIEKVRGGCWLWRGALSTHGYGNVQQRKTQMSTHRAAYEAHHGQGSAQGWVIRHTCDVKHCVNPNHLIPGTQADNMRDMVERCRQFRPTGQLHHNAKLTDDTVTALKRRIRAGEKGVILASEYGVSPSTVSDIKYGRSWTHVD